MITLSLVVSWQGKAAWIVTDDNAAEQGCRDSAWTRDEMAGQLLHALHRTDSRCPLIIIENAHLNHRRILDDLQRAISLIPDGQFFADRQTRSKSLNVILKNRALNLSRQDV